MTTLQKVIKYLAYAFAIFLTVSIIGGILGAVGIFGEFLDNDNALGELETYSVSDNITELDIEINAADFSVKQSDRFYVESNLKNIKVTDNNGILKIKDTKKTMLSHKGGTLVLYLPKNIILKKADIITGAGRVDVDTLSSDSLELELGAGEVKINSLTATKSADIDGGAGKITISDGSLCNLDLDMGVGQLNLKSALVGNSELDLGIGETNLTLVGNKDDYSIKTEKGIGSITIDGKKTQDFNSNGKNRVEINGGVGEINVSFEK